MSKISFNFLYLFQIVLLISTNTNEQTIDYQQDIKETINRIYSTVNGDNTSETTDGVTNLSFNEIPTNKQTILISFDRPRGYYSEVYVTCRAIDYQYCSNGSTYLLNSTGNCSDCTSISISPIIRGVTYKCEVMTVKQNYEYLVSVEMNFNTSLEPVLYNGVNFFNTSRIHLNIIRQSDYSYLELICNVDGSTTYPCSTLIERYNCLTILDFNGILGCTYKCYFITEKLNYNFKYSDEYKFTFFPPKPNIYWYNVGSRWIYITWSISNEISYIQSFNLFINENQVANLDKIRLSYNYSNLLPNQFYEIYIKVNGNSHVLSDRIYIKTLKEDFDLTSGKQSESSIAWIAVFPILILVIIVGLIIWKRKELKECLFKKQDKKDAYGINEEVDSKTKTSSEFVYNIKQMKPKFLVEYINLTEEDLTNIEEEFQQLKNLAPKYNPSIDKCTTVLFDRYSNIPSRGPWSKTAVYLTGNHRLHDYINANEIQGVNSNKQYIACQSPLKDTCEDFWDMIIQYKIEKIIMLGNFQDNNHSELNKCYPYIPMNINQSLDFTRINIILKNIEFSMNNQLEIRYLIIKENKNQYNIIHYLFPSWSGSSVINSQILIHLIETINQHSKNLERPIVVHCSSGTGRTGTYIAVDIIIHLLNQSINNLSTMKLDIMGIVNQLKHDRINMVQTSEQYLLIYHCVEEYLRRINRLDIIITRSNDYETIPDSVRALSPNRYIGKDHSQSIIDNLKPMQINEKTLSQTIPNPTDDEISHTYYSLQNEYIQPI